MRGRIDWKYTLSLELTDSGFDYSVLSKFRARLVTHRAEEKLLNVLLEHFQLKGLLKAGGLQLSCSTHVLAAVRNLNRLENVGEMMRAVLNDLASVAPQWLKQIAAADWYQRYTLRLENYRLP